MLVIGSITEEMYKLERVPTLNNILESKSFYGHLCRTCYDKYPILKDIVLVEHGGIGTCDVPGCHRIMVYYVFKDPLEGTPDTL